MTTREFATGKGLSVNRDFSGHGIGRSFHEIPLIYHHKHVISHEDDDFFMIPGMVFTIEPILNQGAADMVEWDDSWTTVTKDGTYFNLCILIFRG